MGGRVLTRKENLVEKLAPQNQSKKSGRGKEGKEKGGVLSFTNEMVAACQPLKPIKTRPTRPSGSWYSEKQVLTLCKITIFTLMFMFKVKEIKANLKRAEVDLEKAHTSRLVLNSSAHSV